VNIAVAVTRTGKNQYEASLGLRRAVGTTAAAAREALAAQIARAASEPSSPVALHAHGHSLLMWPCGDGTWAYMIDAERRGEPGQPVVLHGLTEGTDKDTCWRRGLRALAQTIYRYGGPDGSSVLEDARDRREHESWVRWQDACHRAADMGLGDRQCRAYAAAVAAGREGSQFQQVLDWASRMEGCAPFACPQALLPSA